MINRPNLEVVLDSILGLAKQNRDILLITSDSHALAKSVQYEGILPEQLIEVRSEEQNLIGVAARLASVGKVVYAILPAGVVITHSLEQVINDVAYLNRPVKIIGINAGISSGAVGTTNHSMYDYAALRPIPNLDIIAPADNFETRKAMEASLNHPRPLYIRLGNLVTETIHAPDTIFEIGKAIEVKQGKDLTFVSTGEPLIHAVEAADLLAQEGKRAYHAVSLVCTPSNLSTAKLYSGQR